MKNKLQSNLDQAETAMTTKRTALIENSLKIYKKTFKFENNKKYLKNNKILKTYKEKRTKLVKLVQFISNSRTLENIWKIFAHNRKSNKMQ